MQKDYLKKEVKVKIKYYFAFFLILLFISACEKMTEKTAEIEEKGSGILVVESVPGDADLFVDNVYKGKTALTLYNFDAGSYSIAIKKEGYENYESMMAIEAGKKTEITAILTEKTGKETQVEEEKEEAEKKAIVEEDAKEEIFVEGVKDKGIIDIGSGLTKYYDFSEKRFTDKLTIGSDVFSRRYPTYFVFIRYSGVEIKVIDKNIDDVKKEDCDDIISSLGFLYSGQTLCINTKEDYVAAIGGTWKETAGSVLSWKIFN